MSGGALTGSAFQLWSVTVMGAPRSLNAERRGHWRTHRQATAADREMWGWSWREVLPRGLHLEAVRVEARPYQAGVLPDAGNAYPSVKAALDGLVDAGFLPDDGPAHVHAVTLHAPQRVKPAEARLTVTVIPC